MRSKLPDEIDDANALVVVLIPDSGRGYLSKIYNDDWMRENGFLSRFSRPTRLAGLVSERGGDVPSVVAVMCDQTVAEAIELLRQHEISQVPVLRCGTRSADGRIEIQEVAGSLQERTLLDHLYRNPDILSVQVSTIMDAPFNLVDANEEIERIFPLMAAGSPAVLVQRDGYVEGVVTRADLLEYAAMQRPGRVATTSNGSH